MEVKRDAVLVKRVRWIENPTEKYEKAAKKKATNLSYIEVETAVMEKRLSDKTSIEIHMK